MRRLEGKVIAVAGGAGRIGSDLVARYASEGASVFIGDINVEEARAVADQIKTQGGNAVAAKIDLASEDSVAAFVKACEEEFGGMDGFHANAAYFDRSQDDVDIVDIEMDLFDAIMSVNARGHALCARHAIPAMLRRGGGVMHPKLEAKAPHLKEWALKRVNVNHLGTGEDIAATAAMLMSDEGRYITGQVLSIDGGSSMRQ